MKYLSRRFFKIIAVYVGIIFAISLIHWDGWTFLESSLAAPAKPAIGISLDNPGIRKAIEIQNRHKEQLLGIPGVVGVGTGMSAKGQPIIRVFTKRAGIPGIPQRIEEIPVDIKVTGMFVAYSDLTARFDRPVPIGVSTGHPDITAGTLGARVKDEDGNVYALSNNHVYANINNASIGDNALQPGTYDGGVDPGDKIGELCDYQPIDFSLFGSNTIDAAIVCTTPGEVGNSTLPDGYGTPSSIIWGDADADGIFDNLDALLYQRVQKTGRTTGLTYGTVTTINVASMICYANCNDLLLAEYAWFDDQIMIEKDNPNDSDAFSMGGDSGSLIVTYDEYKNPVGLLFAGSSTTTLANRIDLVLDRFNVSLDDSFATPGNHLPVVSISSPEDGATFNSGEIISFSGNASDYEDGDLSASLVWTSNLAGKIGEGAYFSTDLSTGTHTITAEVTDSGGASGSTSHEITVLDGSIGTITLTATGKQNRKWIIINLDWSGATSANVDIYRNNVLLVTTKNDGTYSDKMSNEGGGSYTYEVCEENTLTCSNEYTVNY